MATGTSQPRDGRQSLSFLLDNMTEVSTGSLPVGTIGFIKAKGESSVFGDLDVMSPFIAVTETTLGTGDVFMKATPYFLGQATGKSVTASKNVNDVTIDYDGATNNITDGIVTKSGSISGALITESLGQDSGVNILKSRFDKLVEITATGTITVKEANTTEKDNLLIIWNGRNAKVGDLLEMEVIPALFNNLSKGGEYGSSQSFDVDFTGNYSDENGYTGAVLQVENVAGLVPSIVRPVVA